MMRILWVEDNGNVIKNQQYWFGDFLESHDLEHISDFSQADSEISNKLYRYDLIVLDINLEASLEGKKVTKLAKQFGIEDNRAFLEEAGFHLYIKLLEQGFPQTQVIFLTGNVNAKNPIVEKIQNFKRVVNESADAEEQYQAANELAPFMLGDKHHEFQKILDGNRGKEQVFQWLDEWGGQLNIKGENTIKNTYETFEARFKQARLIPPEAFDKKQKSSIEKLQKWLSTHGKRSKNNKVIYDYLTLRRGILNVITEIKEDSTIEFNQTFKELDKTTFLEGLACHLRDFSLPNIEYCQPYSTLCEFLTKPFGEAYNGKDLREDENCHLKLPLYNLRNWIVHGLLVGSNTKLSAQEVGITFLLAMKDIFQIEKYGSHDELKQLFDTHTGVTKQQSFKEQFFDLYKDLSRSQQYYADQRKEPLDVIHRKTNKNINPTWLQENYIRHFYATYLFSVLRLNNYKLLNETFFDRIVFHQLKKHLKHL